MKRIILAILFLIAVGVSSNAQSDSLLRLTKVSLPQNEITKQELIQYLNEQFGYYFSYNPESLGHSTRVQFKSLQISVEEALKVLIRDTNLDYIVDKSQVIFFPRIKNPEVNSNYEVFGFVFDGKLKNPIPYCNIAIVGSSYGTISNIDGYFRLVLPDSLKSDTIVFSCLGYTVASYKVSDIVNQSNIISLPQTNVQLIPIDINYYDPQTVLVKVIDNLEKNYDQNYALYESFYRETVKEDDEYTNISEAVLQIMKAPYDKGFRQDHVKFIKGRKSYSKQVNQQIRFKLQGGPFYITKLDVVKNLESFIDPEFVSLYSYKFESYIQKDGKPTIVISFKPTKEMNDVLYIGKMYIDEETWAVSRIEFSLPWKALQSFSHLFIQKIPLKYKATANDLIYYVDYQNYNGIWYLFSARSEIKINVRKRSSLFKTQFVGVSEIVTTHLERGDFEFFDRHDFFKSSEFITEKIVDYDTEFWKQYNVIAPEEELVDALEHLTNKKLLSSKKIE